MQIEKQIVTLPGRSVEEGIVLAHNLEKVRQVIWKDIEAKKNPNEVITWETLAFYANTVNGDLLNVRYTQTLKVEGEEDKQKTFTYKFAKHLTNQVLGRIKLSFDERILHEITRLPIEFPLPWLEPAESHPHDKLTQDDLRNTESYSLVIRKLMIAVIEKVNIITNIFVNNCPKRDHDLMLSYVLGGEDKLSFGIRLDKVPHKYPEEGIVLGGGDRVELDYAEGNQLVTIALNRLRALEKRVNGEVRRLRKLGGFTTPGLAYFDKEVRTQLFAACHFNRQVYSFDAAHGMELLDKAVNDILLTLDNVGGNIALDISSWVVWEYHTDGTEPTRVNRPEFNFEETILNAHTQSFVDALTGALIRVPSQYLKPYSHRVAADASDGIAIGTVRRA